MGVTKVAVLNDGRGRRPRLFHSKIGIVGLVARI